MERPARFSSRRGLLLVEAVLSAVIIAAGLAFISRGLGSQLQALRRVEDYDTLLTLAHNQLLQLEREQFGGPPHPSSLNGTFPAPYQDYRWAVAATPRQGPDDLIDHEERPLTSDVTFTVSRSGTPSAALQLHTVWPSEWLLQQ